jgi:hypothetical protein
VDPVEVAAEIDVVLGPDLADHLKELRRATVALVMFEPRLTQMGELVLEPAGDDVDREPAAGEVVGGGAELGQHGRMPQTRMDGGDHLEPLGRQQQCQAEAGRLVLELSAVGRFVAHLAQRVLEAVVLRGLRQLCVVLVVPVGALLDVTGHQPTTDVGHPVGELHLVCNAFGCHGETCSPARLSTSPF